MEFVLLSPSRESMQGRTELNQEIMIHLKKFGDKEINNNSVHHLNDEPSLSYSSSHDHQKSNHRYHHVYQPGLKKQFKSLETIFIIVVWYFFSFIAIFLSKHVLDHYNVDLLFFCAIQLGISAVMAYVNAQIPSKKALEDGKYSQHKDYSQFNRDFCFSMAVIGLMRLLVIYLGLLSMKHVALSFMETVKSSAPLFTVIISFVILKEKSGILTQASILPIMFGLLLCSVFEVSFTWTGFLAAMGANVAECLQFVLSKIFLGTKLNPSDFQLYSSITGLLSIMPLSFFLLDINMLMSMNGRSFAIMVIVGFSYYLQTLMAWFLMEFLSPVTHSICNTMKCGVAVWLSVPIFGNHVTLWSGFGSCIVIAGVVLYQKARNLEKKKQRSVAVNLTNGVLAVGSHENTTRNNVHLGGDVGGRGGVSNDNDDAVVVVGSRSVAGGGGGGGGGGGNVVVVDSDGGGGGDDDDDDENLSEEIIQNMNG